MNAPHEPTLRRDLAARADKRLSRRAHVKWCCGREYELDVAEARGGTVPAELMPTTSQRFGAGRTMFNPRGTRSTPSRSNTRSTGMRWAGLLAALIFLGLVDTVTAGIAAVLTGEIEAGGQVK